ncbi:hypothetical protein F8388_016352 [Cannabis sativa]|uniref:Reverse transcriptase zinc-binding domain-containing protein n=1 Tax=Cannabis sativa TaxID=3483 RepID=A0A7J6GUR5_CANSA|nr:hypothetical protein F8388_016352 [Cannabis sativa]
MEILSDLFEERDRLLILKVPLHLTQANDHLVWSKELSRVYSVKSGYDLLQHTQGRWNENDKELAIYWKHMWKLKIPLKVKNLMWRAGMNCLPTMVQLRSKHVNVSSQCPVCQIEDEPILHRLVSCPEATLCWNQKKVGRKPVIRIPIEDAFVGITGETKDVDDSHSIEGLNLIAEMVKAQDLIDTEELDRSVKSRTQSWAEEVEDEKMMK